MEQASKKRLGLLLFLVWNVEKNWSYRLKTKRRLEDPKYPTVYDGLTWSTYQGTSSIDRVQWQNGDWYQNVCPIILLGHLNWTWRTQIWKLQIRKKWVNTAPILTTIDERNTSLLRSVTDGAEAGNDGKGHVPGNGSEVDQGVVVMMTTEGAGLEFWNQLIFSRVSLFPW